MKKLYLSILYVVLLSILIGGTILFSKPEPVLRDRGGSPEKAELDGAPKEKENWLAEFNGLVRQEDIKIFNNEAKVDLHANLAENKNGQVTLNLAYQLNGKLITKSIDASNIAEIRNIFRFREKYGSGYKLNNMLLNRQYDKLYFCVEGKKEKNYSHKSIYSYDLKKAGIERIYYDVGIFGNFSLSPEGKYNAFSYVGSPQNMPVNERSTVVIIRCSDNKPALVSSKDFNYGKLESGGDLYVYSYEFVQWKNGDTCELKQKVRPKDGSQKAAEKTLYYNLSSKKISENM